MHVVRVYVSVRLCLLVFEDIPSHYTKVHTQVKRIHKIQTAYLTL
jgi:hypothetical protein